MKRLTAIVIALMLCAMPALAELWYTDNVLPDGSPVYYFEELSLTLPASWAGRVTVEAREGGTSFYQKASYDKYKAEGIEGGGFLFMLGASVNGSFSELPAFEYLGYSEASAMNYYLQLPSDYPAYMGDEAIRAEYDAMSADVDAIVASVSFYDGNDADADAAEADGSKQAGASGQAGTSEQTGAPTLEETRYHFEHNAMPRYFYEDPANVLDVLSSKGIYRLWTALADENKVSYPYHIGDFDEYWYDLDGGATILQVVMPRPEVTLQCYRLYMIYDPGSGKAGYYTVEYDNMLGETAFLCGWDAEHTHNNYGGAAILDPDSDDYEDALRDEAMQVAKLAGVSAS